MNNSKHSDPAERTAVMRPFYRNWHPTRLGRRVNQFWCLVVWPGAATEVPSRLGGRWAKIRQQAVEPADEIRIRRDLLLRLRLRMSYTDVVGFELQSRDYVARVAIGDVLFELVPITDHGKLRGSGNARFCLSVDDLQSAMLDSRSKSVPTADAGLLSQFSDPDGNEIASGSTPD